MVKRSFWHQVFKAWISCVDIYLVFSFWYILGAKSESLNNMSRYIRNVCGKDSLRSENQRSLTLEVSRSWCSEFRFFFFFIIYKWLCFNTHSVTCTKFRYWYELFSSEGDEKWDTNFTFPNKIEKLKLKKVKMKEWRKRSGGGEKKGDGRFVYSDAEKDNVVLMEGWDLRNGAFLFISESWLHTSLWQHVHPPYRPLSW